MIVYREQRRRVPTAEAIRRVQAASGFDRQIELGELETGVADALSPDYDADRPILRALRRGEFPPQGLPPEIEVSISEGFAYYAVDPELYRRAAAQFAREQRWERVGVIGIRSIGTTLGWIVAEELRRLGCAVDFWTVRPRGHPWNRELRVADELAQAWREWTGWFAVVDEGPGLSGSSFASVSRFLASLGIPEQRVVFFPSWDADGSEFVSQEAARRWGLHRKFVARFEDLELFPGAQDLSAGKWRALRGVAAAVNPRHERRKYLAGTRLYKFAGYGRYGREKRERAERLAGWTLPPGPLEHGFLAMPWVARAQIPVPVPPFLRYVARYLAFVRREFSLARAPAFEPLAEMIAENAPGAPDLLSWRAAVENGCAAVLDGRMLPYEWLETDGGYSKTDALDHGDDHFFPGPQDTAWDVAAFCIEFDLSGESEEWFVEQYRRASGDRDVSARLPFYRLAYLAFRLGIAEMGGADFCCARERYRQFLEAACG